MNSGMAGQVSDDRIEVVVVAAIGVEQHDWWAGAIGMDCDPIDESHPRSHHIRIHDRAVKYWCSHFLRVGALTGDAVRSGF
jgi:hypothetical protein